jgi:hypothetical protein
MHMPDTDDVRQRYERIMEAVREKVRQINECLARLSAEMDIPPEPADEKSE